MAVMNIKDLKEGSYTVNNSDTTMNVKDISTSKPNLGDKLKSTIGEVNAKLGGRITGAVDAEKDSINNSISAPEAGVRIAGNVVGAANDIIGGGFKAAGQIGNAALGGIPGKALDSVAKSPLGQMGIQAVQGGVQSWSDFEQKYPRAAKDLSIIPEFGELLLNIGGGFGAGATKDIVVGAAKTATKEAAEKGLTEATAKNLDSALKRVTPDYEGMSATQKAKLQGETVGSTPRVSEGGIFNSRTVNLTNLEKEAAQELANVPGYKSSLTNLQTENLTRSEIAKRGQALSNSLENETISVPRREITSLVSRAVNKVPEVSLLLQKSDPAIKNYIRVTTNAVNQAPGTLKGVLDVRKTLDNAYQNARGSAAYGSDKIAALDEVHRAARDALTDYMITHAVSTDVKTALRKQWNLYRALDVVSEKGSKEAGSALERTNQFIKKHPVLTAAGTAVSILGAGKAVGF